MCVISIFFEADSNLEVLSSHMPILCCWLIGERVAKCTLIFLGEQLFVALGNPALFCPYCKLLETWWWLFKWFTIK